VTKGSGSTGEFFYEMFHEAALKESIGLAHGKSRLGKVALRIKDLERLPAVEERKDRFADYGHNAKTRNGLVKFCGCRARWPRRKTACRIIVGKKIMLGVGKSAQRMGGAQMPVNPWLPATTHALAVFDDFIASRGKN